MSFVLAYFQKDRRPLTRSNTFCPNILRKNSSNCSTIIRNTRFSNKNIFDIREESEDDGSEQSVDDVKKRRQSGIKGKGKDMAIESDLDLVMNFNDNEDLDEDGDDGGGASGDEEKNGENKNENGEIGDDQDAASRRVSMMNDLDLHYHQIANITINFEEDDDHNEGKSSAVEQGDALGWGSSQFFMIYCFSKLFTKD